MTQDIRITMFEVLSDNLRAVDPEDDRIHISQATRQRMAAKGLQFDVPANPLPVVQLDPILHTLAAPVCEDTTCPCYAAMREQIAEETTPKRRRSRKTISTNFEDEYRRNTAPLNGNRPFNLMR